MDGGPRKMDLSVDETPASGGVSVEILDYSQSLTLGKPLYDKGGDKEKRDVQMRA